MVAIGGNSLIKDVSRQSIQDQYEAAGESMAYVAGMIQDGWEIILTHGNGPQVGFMQRRSELSEYELPRIPLDYSGAHTQGSIGYMLQRSLYNHFIHRGIDKCPVTVVTQTLVDRNDPAFQNPTKPIGSFMDQAKARKHELEDSWRVVEDAGRGWRRVVPSPEPKKILEFPAIRNLIQSGFVVICTGGGGIPVIENEKGKLVGVEAVIDKDLSAALLASTIRADLFLVSTSVEKVALNFNQPDQRWLDRMTMQEAQQYLSEGHFLKGSMEPKIRAIIAYFKNGGKQAIITNPENIESAVAGKTGTHFTRD